MNVSHEMSHIVLEHNFGLALLMPDGCRAVAPDIEEEAAWLAGELLIPYVVALKAARAGWTDEQVAEHFQVSPRLAAWRMNHSGARKVAERQLAFRSSRRS